MELMDYYDKKALNEVLVKWYGSQAANWQMNDSVVKVVIKMLVEMRSCTAALHFIPMPTTFGNQLGQLTKGYLKKVIGVLKDDERVYNICSHHTIRQYRSEIQMASMGL
jgi:hypothetical protein